MFGKFTDAVKGAPKMPSGGAGVAVAVIGITAGAYGLYNSVVTGAFFLQWLQLKTTSL